MHSERTIFDLVGSIYDAVNEPSLWPTFLEKFTSTYQAKVGTLYVQDLQHHAGSAEYIVGMDDAHHRSYREYYAARNLYLIRGKRLLRAGNVMFSEELCPDAEVFASEFHNDWVRPQGLERGLNGVLFNDGPIAGSIGAIRAYGAKPFGDEDKRRLQILLPHLQRAVHLSRRIAQLEIASASSRYALDHWHTAVFLVDSYSHVLLANRAALGLLRRNDGLSLDRGELSAAHQSETAMLRRLIQHVISRNGTYGNGHHGLCISRPFGKSPLNVMVSPSVRQDLFFGSPGTALVFVNDPEANYTREDVLRSLYDLTPAEAKVATLLADGKSVREIADELAIRENTVRIHLKRIFDKTGTRRQAELVKLALTGPATLSLEH